MPSLILRVFACVLAAAAVLLVAWGVFLIVAAPWVGEIAASQAGARIAFGMVLGALSFIVGKGSELARR